MTTHAFQADIRVLLKPSVNDPQGLSIRNALRTLGFDGVDEVRAGKLIQVRVRATDEAAAEAAVDRMCTQLLANPVIETSTFTLRAVAEPSGAAAPAP
jgi:phosphoribosylformylglycinamidine synthase